MQKTILFFHPSSELYGADKILIYIIRNFKEYNKVVYLPQLGPLCELISQEFPDVDIRILKKYPIIAKKNFNPLGFLKFLYSLIIFPFYTKISEDDIIYLNTLAVAPILLFGSNNKKIIHVHEILKNDSKIQKMINRFAIKKADLIISVSKAVEKNMVESGSKYVEKIVTINNGISFNSNIENKIFETNEDKINIALIGRIKPSHKGQILLIEAINKLSEDELKKCHFYFVGSTVVGQEYMLEQVENKIKEYNLQLKITIIPFVKEIEMIYKAVDIIVVPSVFDDPFPTTVLEGMFFSKPVIGTNVGGISEMIDNGVTGYITPREDYVALSEKMKFLLNNPTYIQKMGEKGKIRFNKLFSEESFNKRFIQLIEPFLSK